jgi:Core-2/I-Branching enzyme
MRIAYIISAYKLPEQVVRLVRRLSTPTATVVVHVDRKTSDATYSAMTESLVGSSGVHFLQRHRCYWGGFGHVRATLTGIDHLYRSQSPFDYLVLLTGQDYPLRPPSEIAAVLDAAGGSSFMSWWPVPHPPWSGRGGLDRFERLHLVGPRPFHLSLPARRRPPRGLTVFGGSPYWCLARTHVDYVRRVVDRQPEVVRFFRRAFIPDELFFQTLLLGSPHADSIVNDNLRYIDWSSTPAPKILTARDLPALLASGKLFARKFDASVDAEVLDRLDESIDDHAAMVVR